MATSQLVYTFQATVPAGTAIATPYTTALTFPPLVVNTIQWKVPDGPRGNMGFALGSAGVRVIPYNPSAWIIANDQNESWDVAGQFDSGAWQFFGYNAGFNPHTVYLTFLCSLVVPSTAPTPTTLIDLSTLSGIAST